MTPFETASAFFHACESLEGWAGCSQYVADNAPFSAQSEPIADVNTVEDYCDWMAGLGSVPLKGCRYDLLSSAYDEANSTAIFVGRFHGTHVGEGGPVPATHKTTASDYVYSVAMNGEGKVCKMTKIWNAPWALNELGWV
ncbi:MAG: hypothetical protein V7746_06310 [Halioglobus sp.]